MSILENNRDLVRDGRQDVLGDEAKVSVRDSIVKKLYDQLSDETQEGGSLGMKITRAWSTSTASIQGVLDKQAAYLADLDNFECDSTVGGAFGGVSNIHIPAAFIVCKSYHARFLEALLGVDPPFSMKARRSDGASRVQVAEDLMKYALMQWANKYNGVEDVVDSWIWNWCTTGTGVMKIRWRTEWESFLDVEDIYEPTTPLSQLDPDGNEILIEQYRHSEKEVQKTVKIFDGPQFDLVQNEDIRIVGGEGNPDEADMVLHRQYLTASELWTKVDQGIYNHDVVEFVINAGRTDPLFDDSSGIKQQRKMATGDTTYTDETHLDRYEIIEAIAKYDVRGSGIASDVVVWVHRLSGKILSATYLRRIQPSGERPYAVIHFHKRPGESFGLGLLEILNPMTTELDTMHNIRIDNALFQSQPFYVYRKSANFDAASIVIEPGVGIGVDDPNADIVFPALPDRTGFTAQEEQMCQQYIERLTGISDLSLGVMSSTQGAARSATGVRAILGENNNNLSVHLRRMNKGWSKALRCTWHNLKNRVEPGFAFRITGDDGEDLFRKVNDLDLAMEADFELSANTSNSNKAVQIEMFQTVMQMTQNPINLQTGITTVMEVYRAQKSYLNALGMKDVHNYLKRPTGLEEFLSPEAEFFKVAQGDTVQVTPAQDHAAFIGFMQSLLQTQSKPGGQTVPPEALQRGIQQMKMHMEMQNALAQASAQNAQTQQVAMNQNQVAGQAPPSYNNQQYPNLF